MIFKLKNKIPALLGLLTLIYTHAAFSAVCNITNTHLSGTINLHITRTGTNYPITRNDFHFGSTDGSVQCSSRPNSVRLTGPKSLTKSTDAQQHDAWILPNQGSQPLLGIEPSVTLFTGNPNTVYADGEGSTLAYRSFGIGYAFDVVTLSNNFPVPDGNSSVIYNVSEPIAYISIASEGYTERPAIYLDSLTINYIVSSCGINSKLGSVVNWPSLYKKDIVSGAVESKEYSLSLICGNESDPKNPVNITFSSSQGFANAASGIVKTSLPTVGMKLSWANPNLPPLVLDQINHSTLSGIGDYSVIAKPVALLQNGVLAGGIFDTTVTMNIEFE